MLWIITCRDRTVRFVSRINRYVRYIRYTFFWRSFGGPNSVRIRLYRARWYLYTGPFRRRTPLLSSECLDAARATREATRISANVRTLATRRSRRKSRCRRAAGVTFAHDARSRSAPGCAPWRGSACCSPSRIERRSMLGISAANGAARIADAEELQVLD